MRTRNRYETRSRDLREILQPAEKSVGKSRITLLRRLGRYKVRAKSIRETIVRIQRVPATTDLRSARRNNIIHTIRLVTELRVRAARVNRPSCRELGLTLQSARNSRRVFFAQSGLFVAKTTQLRQKSTHSENKMARDQLQLESVEPRRAMVGEVSDENYSHTRTIRETREGK